MLNELAGAERCVEQITRAVTSLEPRGVLVVVDDGSTDGTGALLDGLGQRNPDLRVVHHSRNLGYGAALRSGAEEAARMQAGWILFMDSDLTNPPEDIARFFEAMAPSVEYVKASRYGAGGGVRGVPLKRRVVSQAGNAFARLLFGLPLSDLTNGFRAIRVEPFLQMPLRERGFAVIMEEAFWVQRLGLRSSEISTVLTSRDDQLRRSSFRYRPGVLYSYARYPIRTFVDRAIERKVRTTRPDRGDDE
jgi:glycosyltransferase involved in cell wall biosynthesis